MVLGILSGSQMAGFKAKKSPVVLKTNTTTEMVAGNLICQVISE